MANREGKDQAELAQLVLEFLNHAKLRCTYGALAGILGVSPRSVGDILGKRRPEASWVVNKATGEPTGYDEDQMHPDLRVNSQVISDTEELRWLVDGFHEEARNKL